MKPATSDEQPARQGSKMPAGVLICAIGLALFATAFVAIDPRQTLKFAPLFAFCYAISYGLLTRKKFAWFACSKASAQGRDLTRYFQSEHVREYFGITSKDELADKEESNAGSLPRLLAYAAIMLGWAFLWESILLRMIDGK